MFQKPIEGSFFDSLIRPLRELVAKRGFEKPTPPQVEAIPKILEGKNTLLIAPTASGKTEAAILPVLQMLLQAPRVRGIKVIYITPLRTLNRDLLERLEWWCKELDLRISVRHGDTAIRERRKQAISPPDLIITTPETLQVILIGKMLSQHLPTVRWVIVDEVHELADNKRGAQLSLSLEQLRRLKGGDFQLIGLSATIGSPKEVAQFLVGVDRECEVLDTTVARKIETEVLYPVPKRRDQMVASELYTYPAVAARILTMRKLVEKYGPTLIFTNTRPMAEILASRFRMLDMSFPISIHHGSLSSFSRARAEQRLKHGELKGVVCTSSMELGLDIGRVDLCVQYNSPRQVTRLVQRVGRSGHRIGEVARGAVIVRDQNDALESVVIAAKSRKRDLEPVPIPDKPLDVLMHELAGLMAYARRWNVDDIHQIFKRAYPYRELSRDELIEVLHFMQSLTKKLAWVSPGGEAFARPASHKRLFTYYFENLSMIPQVKQYLVVDDERNEPVGILDESFIAEYGEPGVKFIVGGSVWKILQVYRNKVYVKPDEDPLGAIPSWIGEEIPVPRLVAQEVGEIRQRVEELSREGLDLDEISEKLSKQYGFERDVMKRALKDTYEQLKLGLPVPTRGRITVEKVNDMHVVQAHFGTLINRTLGRFIAYQASEELGQAVAISIDPYRILLKSKALSPEELMDILKGKLGADFKGLVKSLSEESKFFKWRLVQVARRMGVLEQETEITSRVVDQLMKALHGTPAHEETFKEVIFKDLDPDGTVEVLENIKSEGLELVSLGVREEPSPISSLAWKHPTLGFEPVSGKRLRMLTVASAKARLLSEVRTFACVNCKQHVEDRSVHELDEKPRCPICKSTFIGLAEETPDEVKGALDLRKGRIWNSILRTSKLISKHGKLAAIALAGRGITPETASEILEKEKGFSSRFLELVLKKEREALLQRFKYS